MTIMVDERYEKAKQRLTDSDYAMAERKFTEAFGDDGAAMLAYLTWRSDPAPKARTGKAEPRVEKGRPSAAKTQD